VKQGGGNLGSGEEGSITFICGGGDDYETKTTLIGLSTHWVDNIDKVGIFSPQASTTSGGDPGVENLPLTAMSSGERVVFSGSIFWGAREHNFYSYYPYSVGNPPHTAVPVSLPANQTQSAGNNMNHLSTLDFLVAKPHTAKYPGVSGDSAAISLRYNHVFTVLEFKIRRNSGTGSITKIKLRGALPLAFESGTINLAQEVPSQGNSYIINEITGYSSEVVLSLETPITPTNDFNTTPKAYMVILPWNTPNAMTLVLEIDGELKEIVKSGVSFQRGKKYTILVDPDDTETPVIKGSDLEAVTIGGVTWAPVNAGYDENNKYGLYYQWHRKYGQPYGTTNQNYIMVDLNTGNNPDNCNAFYISIIDPYDWCDVFQNQWDMSVEYNPCPEGWRVPTQDEFKALSQLNSIGVAAGGGGVDGLPGRWMACDDLSNTSESVFFPASGYIRYSGESRNIGAHGYYWTVDTVSVMGGIFRASQYTTSLNGMVKGTGNSVRCVKN